MKVYIPYFPLNPYFKFNVRIANTDDLIHNLPIMQNTVTSFPTVLPTNYISAMTGSENEPNKISYMQTTDSQISFTITAPVATGIGSSLTLATSNLMYSTPLFYSANSCLVNSIAQPCTLTSDSTYTTITI